MVERIHGSERSRRGVLVRAVLVFGIGVPALVLAGLYGVSEVVGVELGTVVFALSGVTALGWLVFAGWSRRVDAARPSSELFRNATTDYGREDSRGTVAQVPLSARALVVLTGTVVLGWAFLLTTL